MKDRVGIVRISNLLLMQFMSFINKVSPGHFLFQGAFDSQWRKYRTRAEIPGHQHFFVGSSVY